MLKISLKNVISLLFFSIPNTILSFIIIYIINNAIAGDVPFAKGNIFILFTIIITFTYLLNIFFQQKLNYFAYHLLYENEKNIFTKMLDCPLVTIEKLGTQRFYTAVEDLRYFANLPDTVTHTLNSLLMLFLCLAYLFTISITAAIIVVVSIVILLFAYMAIVKSQSNQFQKLRKYNEGYYKFVNDVIKGFKDLKLDFNKRRNLLYQHLYPNRNTAQKLDYKINFVFLSINLISQYGLYFIIGIVLFLFPLVGFLEQNEIVQYVVIILFMTGPINNLINMQSSYTRFIVANNRLNKFLSDFEKPDIENEETAIDTFNHIELKNVCFKYNAENEIDFALGPINLKINSGETIFIIGGNGSGKSTFINILTGLYQHSEGMIIINDSLINNNLKSCIAAVFTENYIFSKNLNNYELKNNKHYHHLLRWMEMDKIVQDDNDESVRRGFSKGQSKRMSLIFALLENKPILVLDEWAADQDPYFRKYFYEIIIPELKNQGKTIIAVTHDDNYFKHADRIIKFEYGKIVSNLSAKDYLTK